MGNWYSSFATPSLRLALAQLLARAHGAPELIVRDALTHTAWKCEFEARQSSHGQKNNSPRTGRYQSNFDIQESIRRSSCACANAAAESRVASRPLGAGA